MAILYCNDSKQGACHLLGLKVVMWMICLETFLQLQGHRKTIVFASVSVPQLTWWSVREPSEHILARLARDPRSKIRTVRYDLPLRDRSCSPSVHQISKNHSA